MVEVIGVRFRPNGKIYFFSPQNLALEAGDIPVYMHIPAEKMTLLCPRANWCNGTEACVGRMKEALGESNVVLKG